MNGLAYWPTLTLCKLDELAEQLAEDEVPQQGSDQGHRHAEHAEQDVRDGQVEQKNVGNGAHATVLDQGEHHQQVPNHGAQQDGRVAGHHPDGHIGTDPHHAPVRRWPDGLRGRQRAGAGGAQVEIQAEVQFQAAVVEEIAGGPAYGHPGDGGGGGGGSPEAAIQVDRCLPGQRQRLAEEAVEGVNREAEGFSSLIP